VALVTEVVVSGLPLEDVRVLAIEQFGAGPWATLQLAELGAEVIKLEDPRTGGDVGRYVPPYQDGEDSLFFETFNGGKQSVDLDLKSPAGREIFLRLVARSDVVFSNLRGDVPTKLGLRYADLAPVNERIVCCALTGFGLDGPRAASGALDYVVQGLSGWMSVTGEPGSAPTRAGLSLVDFSGGYVAAIAILGGLWRARREGRGCDCDVSLYETALSLLTYLATWSATSGYVPERQRQSAHPSVVPFQAFEAADGWIVIACPKQELWERLCRAIDRADLLDDPAYATMASRNLHREPLLATLSETLRLRGVEEWIDLLEKVGVPAGRVNDVPAALADPQVIARDGLEHYEHERLGPVTRVRTPLRLSGPRRPTQPGPQRGEHTQELLRTLCGIEAAELASLAAAGAFGEPTPDQPESHSVAAG
jgi:crotonobetainyl-CoA:carnitine CoA-transferase CaiB-like acyl-CoA transferase